jgi:hypothetical protein
VVVNEVEGKGKWGGGRGMVRREVGLGLKTHGEAHGFRAGDPRTSHIQGFKNAAGFLKNLLIFGGISRI